MTKQKEFCKKCQPLIDAAHWWLDIDSENKLNNIIDSYKNANKKDKAACSWFEGRGETEREFMTRIDRVLLDPYMLTFLDDTYRKLCLQEQQEEIEINKKSKKTAQKRANKKS